MIKRVRSGSRAGQENGAFSLRPIAGNKTLADQVTETLTNKILGGEFTGSQLPSEQTMAQGFGVSRTVIREAVSRLKSEGLIDTRQGRGAFVRSDRLNRPFRIDLNSADLLTSLLHIIQLRRGLDAEIAFLAAERRTRSHMTAIRRALTEIDRASKAGHDAVTEDLNFHLSIAHATGNPLFPELLRFLNQFLFVAVRVTRANEDRVGEFAEQVRGEHQAIARAIERRDPEAAAAAAKTHMINAAERIQSADSEFWTIGLKQLSENRHPLLATKEPAKKTPRSKFRKTSLDANRPFLPSSKTDTVIM
ncbi:MAG TPA: FadR/GntR family transcriptional regulator [Terracidiphilus sp.]|jgi:GntR family transcriptional repressor for pyruvate dehydrogenase complex|nr:FadR/GntR family transcriptional regulator [Terracidiphilus sp.]